MFHQNPTAMDIDSYPDAAPFPPSEQKPAGAVAQSAGSTSSSAPVEMKDVDDEDSCQDVWIPKVAEYLFQNNRALLLQSKEELFKSLRESFIPQAHWDEATRLFEECFMFDALADDLNQLKQQLCSDKINFIVLLMQPQIYDETWAALKKIIEFFNVNISELLFQNNDKRLKQPNAEFLTKYHRQFLSPAASIKDEKQCRHFVREVNAYFNNALLAKLRKVQDRLIEIQQKFINMANKYFPDSEVRVSFKEKVFDHLNKKIPFLFQHFRVMRHKAGYCHGIGIALLSMDDTQKAWFYATIKKIAAAKTTELMSLQSDIEQVYASVVIRQDPEEFLSKDKVVTQRDVDILLEAIRVYSHKEEYTFSTLKAKIRDFLHNNLQLVMSSIHHTGVAYPKGDGVNWLLYEANFRKAEPMQVSSDEMPEMLVKRFYDFFDKQPSCHPDRVFMRIHAVKPGLRSAGS